MYQSSYPLTVNSPSVNFPPFPLQMSIMYLFSIFVFLYFYMCIMMQNTKWTINEWFLKHQLLHVSNEASTSNKSKHVTIHALFFHSKNLHSVFFIHNKIYLHCYKFWSLYLTSFLSVCLWVNMIKFKLM